MHSTFVILPSYNDGKKVGDVIKELFSYEVEIVVVDDGSTDNTREVLKSFSNIHIITNEKNMGKGYSLRSGCDYAVCLKAEKIICIDADGQHLPSDIPRFLAELENCDVVIGYRKFIKTMPVVKRWGNRAINKFFNLLFFGGFNDCLSGYKAFHTDIYKEIKWKTDRYNVEIEICSKIKKNKLIYRQLEIDTIYYDKRGITVLDGIKIFLTIIKLRVVK